MNEELAQKAMNLIFSSGNAKSTAMEAIGLAEKGKIQEAKEKIKLAKEQLHEGHQIQTDLMQAEIRGENIEKSILLIHAQDHFMAADTVILLADKMIKMYERMQS